MVTASFRRHTTIDDPALYA